MCIRDRIQTMYPKNKIIVSIEPCVDNAANLEQRLKRKDFYIRNGYRETGYSMKLAGQEQEILISKGLFDKRKFIAFFIIYSSCTTIPKIWKHK